MKNNLTPDQQAWFSDQMEKTRDDGYLNPCVRLYGKGPEGVTCKNCTHLFRKKYSKTYIKCGLRRNTNGPGTDHKAGWRACARYEPGAS